MRRGEEKYHLRQFFVEDFEDSGRLKLVCGKLKETFELKFELLRYWKS
jgi:hypothetical protein